MAGRVDLGSTGAGVDKSEERVVGRCRKTNKLKGTCWDIVEWSCFYFGLFVLFVFLSPIF